MKESIGDRLLIVRSTNNLSQSDMAQRLGIAQSTLSQFETGRSRVNTAVLIKLMKDFDVSADWLLTGRGAQRAEPLIEVDGVPLVDESTELADDDSSSFVDPLAIFDVPGFHDGTFAMFRSEEDAMVPTIFEGDYVIGELVDDLSELPNNAITVTVLPDEYLIRRKISVPGLTEYVRLRTDHPLHEPIDVSLEEIEQTWRVCGRITEAVDPYLRLTHDVLSRVEGELSQIRALLGDESGRSGLA